MILDGIEVNWADGFNGAITVCDRDGIIVYMNDYSIQQFKGYGGVDLMGTNLLDCHPEPSKSMLKNMLKKPTEHMYTTEKKGIKKIIKQTPWMLNGEFAGVIEISFNLPSKMPNFVRD